MSRSQPPMTGNFCVALPRCSIISVRVFYTYILESIHDPARRYIGHTADLKDRLREHNAGKCPHTSRHGPWKLKLYIAFESLEQAQHFERYLKSGSGHAFAHKHFWRPAPSNDHPSPSFA